MRARPYTVVNVAASVDGKIDTWERRGAAISSAQDRARVDALRASVDAVMVGGHTLRDEDPRLTVKSAELRAERLARGAPENPTKVAIVSRLDGLAPDGRFVTAGPARVVVFMPAPAGGATLAELTRRGVEVLGLGAGRVDLVAALAALSKLRVQRLLVEGGGSLNFELARLGLVDELQVYIAPLLFGGASSPTAADGTGLTRASAINLQCLGVDGHDDGGVVLRYKVSSHE